MNNEKRKTSSGDSTPKSSHSKSMKKSSKSRIKSSKPDSSKSHSNGHTPTSSTSLSSSEKPSTPTSSIDSPKEKTCQKRYARFGPRTVKIIWEQHDTSDIELTQNILPVIAEDLSYKMWELAKNIKTCSVHSGGYVTCDLVNEVLKDSDCPPVLGSMDTEWDRIDYDGSYFFNSDKTFELRSEYQRDIQITMAMGPPFMNSYPIQTSGKHIMNSFLQSIFLITLGGNEQDFDTVRQHVFAAPFVGAIYEVLLAKMIKTLAFKQTNHVKIRCWKLLKTLVQHPSCKRVYCREYSFHLAEIFICQLLGTIDAIPVAIKGEVFAEEEEVKNVPMEIDEPMTVSEVKLEDVKPKIEEKIIENEEKPKTAQTSNVKEEFVPVEEESTQPDQIYRLEKDDEEDEYVTDQMEGDEFSPYTADKVDLKMVDLLCETIGLMGATNEFFNTECMHLILKRLEKFFQNRQSFLLSDYEVISRAIRGLFSLGEYAFREFIPFMEKMNLLDDIPDFLRLDFARCAIFLRGHDDIFLYEWLEELCGFRLIPFMTHYAHYHQKIIKQRHLKRRVATFKITPKVLVKRATILSSKSPKTELTSMDNIFPERTVIAKPTSFCFKFREFRPIPVKVKPNRTSTKTADVEPSKSTESPNELLLAQRKLFKSLTDEKKCVHLSNYHLLRI